MKTIHFIIIAGISLSVMSCKQKQAEMVKNINDIPVQLADVRTQEVANSVTIHGALTTLEEAKLSFKTAGIISRIYVKEGDGVYKGQLLAELNYTEIEAQSIQAKENEDKAKRDYQRAESLYADSVISLEQFQNAKTAWVLAKQASDITEYNKTNSRIIAPDNGVVLKRIANEGELIGIVSPVFIVTTKTGNGLILRAGVPVTDWQSLSVGDKAGITIDGFSDKKFNGRVHHLALSTDQSSGLYLVEVKLEPAKERISVGMFANAEIKSGKSHSYKVIPVSSLAEIAGKKGVVYIPEGNKAKKIPVSIAKIEDNNAFISQGLSDIDKVINEGAGFITESSTINIQ